MIENHMVSPFADDGAETMPEISHEEEQIVLQEICPDWRSRFYDARVAWDFFWEFNQPEMETLWLELHRERQAAQFRKQILARRITDDVLDGMAGIARLPAWMK